MRRVKQLPKLTERLYEKLVEWEESEPPVLYKGSRYLDKMARDKQEAAAERARTSRPSGRPRPRARRAARGDDEPRTRRGSRGRGGGAGRGVSSSREISLLVTKRSSRAPAVHAVVLHVHGEATLMPYDVLQALGAA